MRSHLAKKFFEIDAQGQKCQNGKMVIFLPIDFTINSGEWTKMRILDLSNLIRIK